MQRPWSRSSTRSRWLGLDWDEPPTFQLDRIEECAARSARQLVAEGKAYEDEGAIRFRMPDEGVTAWDDAVKGRIEFPNEQLEDLVLVRSDGRPTYNFASPIEDVWDGITHVIRGDDHISNTPKQINILIRALGADLPVYAHVPNVLATDGKKLSKRHGATGVDEFRAAGYVAPALMNFLALLGWSYRRRDDVHVAGRARLALRARAGDQEPGHVRLREARLDERRLSARAPRTSTRTRCVAYLRERGTTGRRTRFARLRRSSRRRSRRSVSSRTSPASSSATSSPTRQVAPPPV